jgi:hypothetical protein
VLSGRSPHGSSTSYTHSAQAQSDCPKATACRPTDRVVLCVVRGAACREIGLAGSGQFRDRQLASAVAAIPGCMSRPASCVGVT